MAFITGVSALAAILMVVSILPFAQSSRAGFLVETTLIMAENKGTRGLEINQKVDVFGNGGYGGSVLEVDEESARQVRTGSDPLHNRENPTRP